MPDKLMRLRRHEMSAATGRPVMIAIAGDSAAGKTTLTRGIAEVLGQDRATAICVDDYHKYDREERRDIPFTVLNPECNYIDIMEQHLQLLALGVRYSSRSMTTPPARSPGRCRSSRETS